MALLEVIQITKVYTDMAQPVTVLKDLSFQIGKAEFVGIFGASGVGKSTFLHILGGIDFPTSGEVRVSGQDIRSMNSEELAAFRNRHVGFVFQFYHLLPEFTALENVMLPALIAGIRESEARKLASESLDAVGLSARSSHRPSYLSGGEQQRVAIARAAVMRPSFILADEPTGNLDRETGEQIYEYLTQLNTNKGIAIVIVTHNHDLISRLPRVYELRDGKLHDMHEAGCKGF